VIAIIEHLIGKGRDIRIYDPHIQLDGIYGSNLSFVVSALPHIGRLLQRSLDELIKSSDTLSSRRSPRLPRPNNWRPADCRFSI